MSEYIGTIIVAAIVLLIVFFIVKGMVKDRKRADTYVVATVPSVMADAVTVSKYQIVGFNNKRSASL